MNWMGAPWDLPEPTQRAPSEGPTGPLRRRLGWIPAGDDRILAHSGLLDPGETEVVSFSAPFVGTYQFVCTFPGHAATMFGNL